jgi:retinol dehydrogenase-12
MNVGPHSSEKVILNTVNPGFCHSSLARRATGFMLIQATIMKFFLARTTEVGGRTLVASVGAGYESHGQYMADCVVAQPSDFVLSDEGKKTEARVYKELMDILEGIQPGIAKNI